MITKLKSQDETTLLPPPTFPKISLKHQSVFPRTIHGVEEELESMLEVAGHPGLFKANKLHTKDIQHQTSWQEHEKKKVTDS